MKNKKRWIVLIGLLVISTFLDISANLLDDFIHIEELGIAWLQSILEVLAVVMSISSIVVFVIFLLKLSDKK